MRSDVDAVDAIRRKQLNVSERQQSFGPNLARAIDPTATTNRVSDFERKFNAT
jgi:hypothetical protein